LHGLAYDSPDLIVVQPILLLQSTHRCSQILVGVALCDSLFERQACLTFDVNLTFQGIVKLGLGLSISDCSLLLGQTQVILDRHPCARGKDLDRQPRVLLHCLVESQRIFVLSALLSQFLRVACERRLALISL
jgi:hypothetical protein